MVVTTRKSLKDAVVLRLDKLNHGHSLGHQDKLANRYVLRSNDGMRVELMFEKDDSVPANLWVLRAFVEDLLDGSLPFEESPKSKLRQAVGANGELQYGRHSALEKMMQLGNADLVCFALRDMADLDRVLAALAQVKKPSRA
jgi:hypothetical protein